jgi:hypothetical protein
MPKQTCFVMGFGKKTDYSDTPRTFDLDATIDLYGRGFELKRDYYTGENFAVCLDWRAEVQPDPGEASYDRTTARKARERIVSSLHGALADPTASERLDYRWMLATMSNTLRALRREGADVFEVAFRKIAPAGDIATFEEGKAAAIALAARA